MTQQMLEQHIRARGGADSGKSPISSGGRFLYACFIIYTFALRLIWDALYPINSTETMARRDDATSDFPLSPCGRCQPSCTKTVASQRYTHHHKLHRKRNAEAKANMEAQRGRNRISSRETHRA